ncbi:SdpI family protein [Terrilactibacillus laevilacticus]|nr:SdpI family protein [Terrilactibacillus laevilacticus]
MKKHWFSLLLLIFTIIVTCISYPYLPQQIAVHWNYRGIPDSFSHKSFGAFVIPVIMLVLYLVSLKLPKIDPKKKNYERFQGTYFRIINGILLFLFLIQLMQIISGLGKANPKYIIPELIGLLFIYIGNLSPKFKPNYFIGIRTPWTLANDVVWKKTHRLGGKIFVILGLLLLLVPVLPVAIQAYFTVIVILICLASIVFSSYYFSIKL